MITLLIVGWLLVGGIIWVRIKRQAQKPCNHLFKANEMQPRDKNGMVKWECSRCHKVFVEKCGLDVLQYGDCDGRWDLPNKFYDLKL